MMLVSHPIRVWVWGLVLCGLFAVSPSEAAELPQARDVWYAYVAGDQRYGYEHLVVRRQDDGNFCYEAESRVLTELLGQRQELTEKGKYVVTSQLVPVSLELETRQASGMVRISGRATGDGLAVCWQREGLHREVTFDLGENTTFAVCLDDWLRAQATAAVSANCHVIDVSSLVREPAYATRGPKPPAAGGVVWTVHSETLGQGEIVLDANGIRQERRYRMPTTQLVRSTPDEAQNIRHRTLSQRELLMFPVTPPAALPATLTALTVRLSWRGLPWEQFGLEDERQHLVRRSETDGRYEAIVRIEEPKPFETTQGYPVEGEEFKKYLAETLYIKPKDAAIVRQAKAWTEKESSAIGAVRALSSGVFQHMQGGSMIAETLTGPEVLETRKGKCSEYSVLFASLARSVGIPTRIVLGMRMIHGSWIGHMWTEAYVGRWITVDTTTDEVGHAPSLLKLVDSDRVMGTQAVRWGVAESLEVTVDDFSPRPAANGYKTGIEGPVYTNAELGCRLTSPHKEWTLVDAKRGPIQPPTVRFKVPGHDDVLIHFVAIGLPPALNATMLMDARLGRLKTIHKEFEVLKNESYHLPRTEGRILVFRNLKEKPTPTRMKTTEILWQEKTGCFLLNLIADEASHDQYLGDFFRLLDGFETLPAGQGK